MANQTGGAKEYEDTVLEEIPQWLIAIGYQDGFRYNLSAMPTPEESEGLNPYLLFLCHLIHHDYVSRIGKKNMTALPLTEVELEQIYMAISAEEISWENCETILEKLRNLKSFCRKKREIYSTGVGNRTTYENAEGCIGKIIDYFLRKNGRAIGQQNGKEDPSIESARQVQMVLSNLTAILRNYRLPGGIYPEKIRTELKFFLDKPSIVFNTPNRLDTLKRIILAVRKAFQCSQLANNPNLESAFILIASIINLDLNTQGPDTIINRTELSESVRIIIENIQRIISRSRSDSLSLITNIPRALTNLGQSPEEYLNTPKRKNKLKTYITILVNDYNRLPSEAKTTELTNAINFIASIVEALVES